VMSNLPVVIGSKEGSLREQYIQAHFLSSVGDSPVCYGGEKLIRECEHKVSIICAHS